MSKIIQDLQKVPLTDAEAARVAAIALPTNETVRKAADARLQFEDEPAAYLAFLGRE